MMTQQILETNVSEVRSLYLELIKKCLMDGIYGHLELVPSTPQSFWKRTVVNLFATRGLQLIRTRDVDQEIRLEGRDWPVVAHTMIGAERLSNLQRSIEDVIQRGVRGDLIETGVWRGGATILMRAVLKAYNVDDRAVWVADSFEGLPKPDPQKYPKDIGDLHHTYRDLAVPIEDVKANFARYGLLDEQVRFLKGWFRDTLPTAPINKLAVIRLDGDMYESTIEALIHLYPKLSSGGYVIVDDYGVVPACREAVNDFRASNGITDEMIAIDWSGVYWQRSC
jgi:O-methyltransferase